MDPESYLTCPYNPAHRILAKRMATHVVKCRKARNPKDNELSVCMFNTTHKIADAEYQHHMNTCPDRFNLDKHVFIPENYDRKKFPLPVLDVEGDENWDDENIPAYNPDEYCRNNPVLRQHKVESAAKRRDFRFEERQRIQRLQDMAPVDTDANVNTHRSTHTKTSMAAISSRVLEEDNPYTVEKLQEKVRLGGQQITFAQSRAQVETEIKREDPVVEVLTDKLSGLNVSVMNKIGKGRGRNVAK